MLPDGELYSKQEYNDAVHDIFREVVRMVTNHNRYVVCIYDRNNAGGGSAPIISIRDLPSNVVQNVEPTASQDHNDSLTIWLCLNKRRPNLVIIIIATEADLPLQDQRIRAMLKRKYHESKVAEYQKLEAGVEADVPPAKRLMLGFSMKNVTTGRTAPDNIPEDASAIHNSSFSDVIVSVKDYILRRMAELF